MHALHFDPRRILVAALAGLAVALAAAAALPQAIENVSFGGSDAEATESAAGAAPAPAWRTDPLSPPLPTPAR